MPEVTLTKKELGFLMYLVNKVTPETANKFQMDKIQLADLYLQLGDVWDELSDNELHHEGV